MSPSPQAERSPGTDRIPLSPFKGFVDSVPRDRVGIDHFTGPSLDWLMARGNRIRRRPGSAIFGDTLTAGHETNGILETAIGFKARAMYSAALPMLADGYPTPLILYTEEATEKAGTLAFRNTNGTDDWRMVGDDFGATRYPDSGQVYHRVVPMLYENKYGGLTLHRLNSAQYRQFLCAGSRELLLAGGGVISPGGTSCPIRWNGRVGADSSDTDEATEVYPAGIISPLQVPACSAGNSLGATFGPWKGSEAFFYSIIFENYRGELSMFPIPRPPGSAWAGFPGFGYFNVDAANPTDYYDSVVFSNIPVGDPSIRYVHGVRSGKVDTANSSGGAVSPAVDDLQFMFTVPNGVTTYVLADGNDVSLDNDPRILDMIRKGLQWPKCAQSIGAFDGHATIGALKPNKGALIVAPWENGAKNKKADDATLYGTTSYFVAVTPSTLYLRSCVGGAATDTTIALAGLTLRELVDTINHDASLTTTAWTLATFSVGAHAINLGALATGVLVGDIVVSAAFPAGTKVTGHYGSPVNGILVDQIASRSNTGATETVTTVHRSGGTNIKWAAGVVPGADADESCDSLLRTYVGGSCRFSISAGLVVTTADAPYITPGMTVQNGSGGANPWPAGTVVTEVTDATHIKVSNAPTRNDVGALETVDFGYDTGDTTLGKLPGFVRTFANSFPCVLYWSKAYLDRFEPQKRAISFSGASPGYAQNGVNTYFEANTHRSGLDTFGAFMGFADMGPFQLHFFTRARMRLWNSRTGETRNDADYTQTTVSWTRGARSPYAIRSGNGWAFFLSDGGIFATAGGMGDDKCISDAIYDPTAPVGRRGQLEYAIRACIAASESDSDAYKLSMDVIGSVLHVRYWKGEDSTDFDREIRYDFSEGEDHSGLAEVLRPDGSPYPWSTPQRLGVACSVLVPKADGVHHYAALNSNSGTTDGRVDEIDTGTTDNGTVIQPVGYTGTLIPENLSQEQPLRFGIVGRKAESGLSVGMARDSRLAYEDMEFDDVQMPATRDYEYGREVVLIAPGARTIMDALTARVSDDGSGECPEVSRISLYADPYDSIYGKGGGTK